MSQKKAVIVGASIIFFLFLAGFAIFFLAKQSITVKKIPLKETQEDVLMSLTAPAGQAVEVPPDVLKSLTAPEGKPKTVPKDVLDSLTAPK